MTGLTFERMNTTTPCTESRPLLSFYHGYVLTSSGCYLAGMDNDAAPIYDGDGLIPADIITQFDPSDLPFERLCGSLVYIIVKAITDAYLLPV